jgi:hypothetical protein
VRRNGDGACHRLPLPESAVNSDDVKFLDLPVLLERREAGGSFYMVVAFRDLALNPWTLGLVLLRQEMIRQVRVSGLSGKTLLIDHDPHIPPQERAIAQWDGRALSLTLGDVELEYWIAFFLRHFRDGDDDDRHLDLDASVHGGGGERMDIVLKAERAGPARSPADSRRRIGR